MTKPRRCPRVTVICGIDKLSLYAPEGSKTGDKDTRRSQKHLGNIEQAGVNG